MTIERSLNLLATVTLAELMVAIGLGASMSDVAAVARDWRRLARAALANYLCVPAAAVGLLLLFDARPFVAAGFLIAAVCPGAPYGPPFTAIAKGNVPLAVGLMTVLAGSSALLSPLLLFFLVPLVCGEGPVQVNTPGLLAALLLAQLLPLCAALALRRWLPDLAGRLKRPADLLSVILNLATLGLIVAVHFDMLLGIPLRGYAGMSALVIAALIAGSLLGGPRSADRTALAMATAVRNMGVSLVIATGSFAGTEAVTAATAFALFQTIVLALVAAIWGRVSSTAASP